MKKLTTCILTFLFTVTAFSQTVIEKPRHGLSSDPDEPDLALKNKELNMLDSLTKSRPFTAKAVQLKRSGIGYRCAYHLMDYNMSFEGAYRTANKIPSSQRSLQVRYRKDQAIKGGAGRQGYCFCIHNQPDIAKGDL